MNDIEKKLNKSELVGHGSRKETKHMIPGIHNIESVGSKPLYKTGVALSPTKQNPKEDANISSRIDNYKNNHRNKESRRSLSRSKDTHNTELMTGSKTLVRNQSELGSLTKPVSRTHKRGLTYSVNNLGAGAYNPITNPINLPNPYAKYAKDQMLNNSQLYNFPS